VSEQLAVPVALQRGRPVAWWGVLMLVATESALFGAMIASYFYLWFESPQWPPPGVGDPKVLVPTLLTVVLLGSSFPAADAARAARLRDASRTGFALALTAVLAAVYAAGTSVLIVQEWHDAPATKDAYSSLFFTIQGAHVAHVAAGVLVNLYLLATVARGRISQYRMNGVWAIALYWHFVNVLAVFVLLTTISPAL
jgi:heme/copper-type cytochrome/quinol oxidase subunit 3